MRVDIYLLNQGNSCVVIVNSVIADRVFHSFIEIYMIPLRILHILKEGLKPFEYFKEQIALGSTFNKGLITFKCAANNINGKLNEGVIFNAFIGAEAKQMRKTAYGHFIQSFAENTEDFFICRSLLYMDFSQKSVRVITHRDNQGTNHFFKLRYKIVL